MKRGFWIGSAVAALLTGGMTMAQETTAGISPDLFPPKAKPGECYTRVFVAPTYKTVMDTMEIKQASSRIEIVPAQYETVAERVLVEEASTRLEVVPAEYGWAEERMLVKPESKRMVEVPASYETVTEKVLVRGAHAVWKEGRGPRERVDNSTGEIMCLVEVPAEYQTVTKRVLKSPASTREEVVPAEYKTVRKRIVSKPATTRQIEVPAKYDTVQVRKLVTPGTTREVKIPGESRTLNRQEQITEGRMAWREILCETNTTPDVIRKLQAALRNGGYEPGPIDGVVGQETLTAISRYQAAKGLVKGGLTVETLNSLGVL